MCNKRDGRHRGKYVRGYTDVSTQIEKMFTDHGQLKQWERMGREIIVNGCLCFDLFKNFSIMQINAGI